MSSTKKKSVPAQSAPATPALASPAPATAPDPDAAFAAAIAEAISQIGTIEVSVGLESIITPAQKQRATKMRKGASPSRRSSVRSRSSTRSSRPRCRSLR